MEFSHVFVAILCACSVMCLLLCGVVKLFGCCYTMSLSHDVVVAIWHGCPVLWFVAVMCRYAVSVYVCCCMVWLFHVLVPV